MNDLKPTVIVLSNGNDANYMHPRLVSLQTYAVLVPATTVFQVNKCFRPAPCANVPDAQIADPETTDTDGTILTTVTGTSNTFTLAYGSTSRPFTIKTPINPTPLAPATPGIVITKLLPNPVGADEQAESVTIQNKGSVAVNLFGWKLEDRSGATWSLTGSIAPNQSRTFKRNGQAMSLNNAGDEIVLRDAGDEERDRFAYAASTEGAVVNTGH